MRKREYFLRGPPKYVTTFSIVMVYFVKRGLDEVIENVKSLKVSPMQALL